MGKQTRHWMGKQTRQPHGHDGCRAVRRPNIRLVDSVTTGNIHRDELVTKSSTKHNPFDVYLREKGLTTHLLALPLCLSTTPCHTFLPLSSHL
jgi:hypothetical protein